MLFVSFEWLVDLRWSIHAVDEEIFTTKLYALRL